MTLHNQHVGKRPRGNRNGKDMITDAEGKNKDKGRGGTRGNARGSARDNAKDMPADTV